MRLLRLFVGFTLLCTVAIAAPLTSPREHFGFAIGDDYHLATFTQTEAYFRRLAAESERVRWVDMGRTEEGRVQPMLIISAPENLRNLERYKAAARRLARAEDLTPDEARTLAAESKAVVWIDGGLHASETVGSHQLIETAWQLASGTDPETERILRDVIVLLVHANPDGQELVANWYMREPDPAKRVLTATPRLYQKYIGHDNNRDFYASTQRETTNINRQLFLEWYPQVVYNHHQPGPVGAVMFIPPFRDPFNYNFDPLVVAGIEALGTAIQQRFLEEGMPGATSRSGANYSTWFNGGLRTVCYFHNSIGLLTEVIGNPTPMRVPFVVRRQLPTSDLPAPVAPQTWHFRQSIAYDLAANRAVLDYASRYRETLLLNIYRMGRHAIERGRKDSWTARPTRLDEVSRLAAAEKAGVEPEEAADSTEGPGAAPLQRLTPKFYEQLRRPELRDPRGYILASDQPDFPTAVKFINALLKTGVLVERATAEFTVAGHKYPAGSFIVKTDQAFRPHVLDMFEPQDHPNDFKYEGGPPNRPYDVTGYTLALQMGVRFDRVLDAFEGPFAQIPYGELQRPPAGRVLGDAANAAGFLVSHRVNDSVILVNRLLQAGAEVNWLAEEMPGDAAAGRGTIYIPNRGSARTLVEEAAASLGLVIQAVPAAPQGTLVPLAPVRLALWERFGGSMPSGWTRWLLEQFEFPFDIIYPQQIDAGHLREKYDAIVFVTGAVPAVGGRAASVTLPKNLPAEFATQTGRVTAEKSIPALKEFLTAGGTVVAIGSSTNLAYHLGLPLQNALVEKGEDGKARPLPPEKFYVPGSILSAAVDTADPLAWGLDSRADVYFERSQVFALPPEAAAAGLKRVVWFDSAQPLRSGWAWGQSYLNDGTAVCRAPVGRGQLVLFGVEVAFRGQTHGTFKLLFNAIYLSKAGLAPATP